jgi:hypothetical protein
MDAGSGFLHCGQGVPLSFRGWAVAVAESVLCGILCGIRTGARAGGRVTRVTRGTKDTFRAILCKTFIF